ncbi:hypothetical protein WJX72_011264 [[Myrmecia] bisecta]|uniref:Uncharacterized protein n=1 Tax=[Myrmecia] bisecta TaxID=41462 RepID=A0AAW1PBT3_9CHLO
MPLPVKVAALRSLGKLAVLTEGLSLDYGPAILQALQSAEPPLRIEAVAAAASLAEHYPSLHSGVMGSWQRSSKVLLADFVSEADAKSDLLVAPVLQSFTLATSDAARLAASSFLKGLIPSAKSLSTLQRHLKDRSDDIGTDSREVLQYLRSFVGSHQAAHQTGSEAATAEGGRGKQPGKAMQAAILELLHPAGQGMKRKARTLSRPQPSDPAAAKEDTSQYRKAIADFKQPGSRGAAPTHAARIADLFQGACI